MCPHSYFPFTSERHLTPVWTAKYCLYGYGEVIDAHFFYFFLREVFFKTIICLKQNFYEFWVPFLDDEHFRVLTWPLQCRYYPFFVCMHLYHKLLQSTPWYVQASHWNNRVHKTILVRHLHPLMNKTCLYAYADDHIIFH